MVSTRDQFIEATSELLELQGYQATGLNQIVLASGAPKGSLYYYFPGGKEELVAEAVGHTANIVAGRIRTSLAEVEPPGEAIRGFVRTLAHHVQAAEFGAGGPITTAALEAASTSEPVRLACLDAYCLWRQAFEDKLVQGGCDGERAARLAALIIAALEGAIILSRTERSIAPLEHVAVELAGLVESATESGLTSQSERIEIG